MSSDLGRTSFGRIYNTQTPNAVEYTSIPSNINKHDDEDDRKSYYKIPWWFVIGGTLGAAAIITIAVVQIIKLRNFAKAQLERAAELDAMAMAYSDYAESWRATFGLPPIFDHSQTSRFKSKPIGNDAGVGTITTPNALCSSPQEQNKNMEEDVSSLLQSLQSQVSTLNVCR
jgi:hypothetical protein